MKIIYIGSDSPLSLIPLNSLIKSNHQVCAIAFDDVLESDFYVANPGSLRLVALNNEIQIINLNEQLSDNINKIKLHQPDVIIVSCYPRLIPQSIFSIPVIGSFNIHPSLLPKFRGPTPLFWQFREGVENFGVTLHGMTEQFDTGDIVSQEKIILHDGLSANDATKLVANMDSHLLLKMLEDIESDTLPERIQNNNEASYQSYPEKLDYIVSANWTAKRLYNFMRAYNESNAFFPSEINHNMYYLYQAVSYQDTPFNNMNEDESTIKDNQIIFPCCSGYIKCLFKIM